MAYHGDLQKKAAMEQKRNMNGEQIDVVGSGNISLINIYNFVYIWNSIEWKANGVLSEG